MSLASRGLEAMITLLGEILQPFFFSKLTSSRQTSTVFPRHHEKCPGYAGQVARWSPGLRRLVASSLAQQYQHLKLHKLTEPAPDTPRDKIRQNIHPVQVTIGHKQRPIRDGAGKTSSHRLPLGHRPRQPLLKIGKALAAYAGTANSLRASTSQGHAP